jgi:hypothetical protein
MIESEPVNRECLLRELRELLVAPVCEEPQLDGSIVMVGGDPGEVIIRVRAHKVSIAVFSIRWEGPHTPLVRPKHIATLSWQRLPASTLMRTLQGLIRAACEVRTAQYRECERFGKTNPPEWMPDEKTCQRCAERYLLRFAKSSDKAVG